MLLTLISIAAHAQVTTLDLINEYPATSASGEADAFFAEAVRRKTDGRVIIRPIPDAKSGLRTREQVVADPDSWMPAEADLRPHVMLG